MFKKDFDPKKEEDMRYLCDLCKAASPAPWQTRWIFNDRYISMTIDTRNAEEEICEIYCGKNSGSGQKSANAEFIAYSITAVPALVKRIIELESELECPAKSQQ